jgi:hypothetical protein
VLAGPTIDPAFRSLGGLLQASNRDHRREPPDLDEVDRPERDRAGVRRVLHGADDLLCTEE